MWILLGSFFEEEDFGSYQLHKDVFIGVFDSYEIALEHKVKAQGKFEMVEIVQVENNKSYYFSLIDWYGHN